LESLHHATPGNPLWGRRSPTLHENERLASPRRRGLSVSEKMLLVEGLQVCCLCEDAVVFGEGFGSVYGVVVGFACEVGVDLGGCCDVFSEDECKFWISL
jgi:hypothetical protein